jgi:hypothetical protein
LGPEVGDLVGEANFNCFAALALFDLRLEMFDFFHGGVDFGSENTNEETYLSDLTAS